MVLKYNGLNIFGFSVIKRKRQSCLEVLYWRVCNYFTRAIEVESPVEHFKVFITTRRNSLKFLYLLFLSFSPCFTFAKR